MGNPRLSLDGTTPVMVGTFKDAQGRIKRQAARFQVFVYDEDNPDGRPLKIWRSGRRWRQSRHAGRHPVAGLSREQKGVLVPVQFPGRRTRL